ncbi:hypothetical protein GA0070562_5088 [Micromonospora tulbaghiae]|uniref:Uncharacterized protein n=2 Tax=Micromonospora tulbaghiae TaxID=479978 RepID=A0ABY0KQP2_9ACTN|nr:hypothetical protein GA0070562_5088 [Micromonospora tulbaghiae]
MIDELEVRIADLRSRVRRALADGDRAAAIDLRAQLREAEYAWDVALQELAPIQPVRATSALPGATSLLPVREQVHQVLTLLTVASAPKMIVAVHEAFFSGDLVATQLTSLRRDERNSFETSPHARPYYLCNALTADRLTPVRALVAVSSWPLDRRMIGPLSARVDFLTAAIRIGEHLDRIGDPSPQARRLLWRFASNIPGAASPFEAAEPTSVISAARAELEVHDSEDRRHREAAGQRARKQLGEVEQLFGAQPMGILRSASPQ